MNDDAISLRFLFEWRNRQVLDSNVRHETDCCYHITIQHQQETGTRKMDLKECCSPDPVITCPFYLANRCRFSDQCRNHHPVDQLLSSPNSSTETKPKKKETIETERGNPKMRTASDVIHRIVWDPAINASDFRVIYLDRFTGLGCVTLAEYVAHDADDPVIPQHRIQQICYCPFTSSDSRCGWVVWEKKSRTDYVFGSAGNAGTIKLLELIEHVNKTSHPLTHN